MVRQVPLQGLSGAMAIAYGLIAMLRNDLSHNPKIEFRRDGVAIATVRAASGDSNLQERILQKLQRR